MKEAELDLWTTPADALCITTNGAIKNNGEAVMGRGCALDACRHEPGIQRLLGELLVRHGNHVQVLRVAYDAADLPTHWVSFPVKHIWSERAELGLIERSARELMHLIGATGWQTVLLPRPGCGNGRLRWPDVRERIAPILDDRVVVVNK